MSFKRALTKLMTDAAFNTLNNKNKSNNNALDYSNYTELWWDDFAPIYNDLVDAINDLGELYDIGRGNYPEDLLDTLLNQIYDLYDEYHEISGGTILKGFDDKTTRHMVVLDNIHTTLIINKNNPYKAMEILFGK